jgi:hypothetical protein
MSNEIRLLLVREESGNGVSCVVVARKQAPNCLFVYEPWTLEVLLSVYYDDGRVSS